MNREKLIQASFEFMTLEEKKILMPDRDTITGRVKDLISKGAPEWELDYWESWGDEIERIDRHRLGNLAYGQKRINPPVCK